MSFHLKLMGKTKTCLFVMYVMCSVNLINLINCDNTNKTKNVTISSSCPQKVAEERILLTTMDRIYIDIQSPQYKKYSSFNKEHLKHHSIIYGLIAIAEASQLNKKCHNEMTQIYEAINQKEIWAMKLIDSSGQPEAGFMLGHNHWVGSQKGCESVQNPLYITLSDRFDREMKSQLINSVAPFQIDYKIVYAKHHSPWQLEIKFMTEKLLHIGLCLPRSCENEEIHNLTQKYFDNRVADVQDIFEFDAEVIQVKDLKLRNHFFTKKSVLLLCAIIVVTALLTLLSSVREERPAFNSSQNKTESDGQRASPSFSDRLLESFSLRNNWQTIMSDSSSTPDSIPVINGIKSLACFLILAFHMMWFSFFASKNPAIMFYHFENFRFQVVSNAPLMVDLFFTISGFLVTYNFLKNHVQIAQIRINSLLQNIQLFGKFVLHRYIRLSPLYLISLLLTEISTSYIADTSKFWIHDRTDLNCQRHWWRNILYIQNLFHADDMCAIWSWSLACEMQFYLVFMIMLFIYVKNESLGEKLYAAFAALVLASSTYIAMQVKFSFSFDVIYNTLTVLYINPLVRITPYIAGVACGWFLQARNEQFQKNSRFLLSLSVSIILSCLHSTVYRGMPPWIGSLVLNFGRGLCGLSLGYCIIASKNGHDSFISRFLSLPIFVHLNKLSYAIYLLNPIIIIFFFGTIDGSFHLDPVVMVVLTFGITIMTYCAALVCSLFFELPYYKLSSTILKRSAVKKKSS